MDQLPAETAAPSVEIHRVRFHADATEYFKIWIVNLALTIVTLGIYSAWAKVRTRKYIDGNIEVAGARFDYHGDPIKILKGRILIVGLAIGYSLGQKISPIVSGIFALVFLGVFPWILVRALIFALRNTSFRGIRFGFPEDYKASYEAYGIGLLVTVVTLGLGAPFAAKLHADFRMKRLRYGNTQSTFSAPTGAFFKIYYGGMGIAAAGAALMGLMASMFAITASKGVANHDAGRAGGFFIAFILAMVVFYGLIFIGATFIRARMINLVVNNTKFGPVEFRSNLPTLGLLWIYFSNYIACVFTLGLMIPWAIIRAARYRFDHMQVHAPANAFEFFETEAQTGPQFAAADAAADFWDIDLGF